MTNVIRMTNVRELSSGNTINTTAEGTYTRIDSSSIDTVISSELESRGIEFTRALQHRVGTRNTKHCIVYTLHSVEGLRFGDSRVTPQIYVFNSYQKESALTILVGFLRAVCSNGMVVGEDTFSTRIIHRTGPTLSRKVNEIQTGIAAAIDFINSGELQRLTDDLYDTEITVDQGISIISSLPVPKRAREDALAIWTEARYRRYEDSENNVWSLWNIVNECMRTRSRSTVANLEKNRGLLDHVMALYEHEVSYTDGLMEVVA